MIFSSMEFAAFIAIFFPLYWCTKGRSQNLLLLAASYFFYACWDWRFCGLLLTSSAIAFFCGRCITVTKNRRSRKAFLAISICSDLGILFFFKYSAFFTDTLLGSGLPGEARKYFSDIVLPVGISFYTFQSISLIVDVYRNQCTLPDKFTDFLLYVSFFPQLVAGPIERGRQLLPQVLSERQWRWERAQEGAFLFFWGLFQKAVIADNLAPFVDGAFKSVPPYSGAEALLGSYAFAFQIYGDFAGYSNMARGIAKLLGFELMVNFNRPYLAQNPRDFWHRWHISLSEWLRDYVYLPLGGNRGGRWTVARNLMITMVLGGLWHGAAFTYIAWGAYHGLLLILHRLMPKRATVSTRILPRILKTLAFFHLACIGWIFFRASSVKQALGMLQSLITGLDEPPRPHISAQMSWIAVIIVVGALSEALRGDANAEKTFFSRPVWVKAAAYTTMFYLITIWGVNHATNFIYFQF